MRILAIATASGGCAAAVVDGGTVRGARHLGEDRGLAGLIAPMLAALLAEAGQAEAVAVIVGPGSFTGLRAGIAVATGLAMAAGIPIIGVTVAEAIADSLGSLGGRVLWVATESRRGQVVLDIGGVTRPYPLDSLPTATGPVAVAGDAANAVAAALAARGADVMLTVARHPLPLHVAAVGLRRLHLELPPCPALPLYAEDPRVTLGAETRPPPLPAAPR